MTDPYLDAALVRWITRSEESRRVIRRQWWAIAGLVVALFVVVAAWLGDW